VIIVHNFEYSLETNHSSRTSFCKTSSKFFNQFIIFVFYSGVVNSISSLVVFGSAASSSSLSVVFNFLSCTVCCTLISMNSIFVKWCSFIGTEQISVMILSISFSGIHILNFLFGTSEWHICWIGGISFKTPCIGYHKIKVLIIFNIA